MIEWEYGKMDRKTTEYKKKKLEDQKDQKDQAVYPCSTFLIARGERTEEQQKELLYRLLGPVFFGEKQAENLYELVDLFRERYGIDVRGDFCEGDEHYEEYLEAQQAIAEGMSIYGGAIAFEDCVLAELAEQVWERMEEEESVRFRRINTMLEE